MKRNLWIALAVLAAVAAAGCSRNSVTGPMSSTALSPATRSGLATVCGTLKSPARRSLDALRFATGPAALAGRARPMLQDAVTAPALAAAATASQVRDIAQELSRRIGSPAAAVIPPEVRGTTYVFDPGAHRYVPDPSRTGAPENGVRYILYAADPVTHEPIVSEEIGYADLTDEGDASPNTAALRLRAVSGGVTFADYRVSLAAGDAAGQLAVAGAFFDGGKHLDFAIQAYGEQDAESEALTIRFRLAVPEDAFGLVDEARAVATSADSTLRVNQAIAMAGHAFAIASEHRADRADATVAVDGVPFARIHADPSTLVVVGANGDPLPPEQRVTLAQLLGLFDQAARVLDHLLAPVGALFALVPRA